MPRNGEGIYTLPPNTEGVPGQVIASAKYNTTRSDIAADLNFPRPITAGGTGASNATDALTNLGGVGVANFLNGFAVGDFFETARTLDSSWLKRNGALHLKADYPELGDLMPALPDGVTWSSISSGATDIRDLLAAPSVFLLASKSGTNGVISSSTDARNWSVVTTIPNFDIASMSYGGGIYMAIDAFGKFIYSNDSITWSSPVAMSPAVDGIFESTYGNGVFVAVGTQGSIRTSPDAITWVSRDIPGYTSNIRSVRYINNLFIITANTGIVYSSPDGITWTLRTTGVTDNLYASAFLGGTYVVVGLNGRIITSTNLTGWTSRTSGTTATLQDVLATSTGFLTVGNSGIARISSNGTTWTATPTGVSENLVFSKSDPSNPSRYLVGGGNSLVEGIRTLPTQFRVPNDDPVYGWIRALPIED